MSALPQGVQPVEAVTAATDHDLPPASEPRVRRAVPVRALVVAGFAAAMSALAWVKLRWYLYDDIDLALFTQALERCLHGSTFVSIRGMSWLGDHASYVLFPLAPVYALARQPLTLLVTQSVVLALGAIPVERMAARALPQGEQPARARWAFVAAYLLSPALWHLGLFEFHPEVVATTALLFAIDALARDRVRACLAWAGLALLAREDVALVAVGLGAWALLFRRPRSVSAGAGLVALGSSVLATTLLVVRPHFASAAAQYGAMYHALGDSPGAVLAALARDPLHALARLVSTPGSAYDTRLKLEMLVALLAPLAFLPLLAPSALLVALPVLAEHLLSERAQQHTIVYHYTALLIPLLAWGAALGLARLGTRWPRLAPRVAVAMLGTAILGQLAYGPFAIPGWSHAHTAERAWPSERDRFDAPVRDRMIARLPAAGTIVAGFEFLPRLASRDDVHSLHHLLSGTYTYSSEAYPVPPRVDAVLADWSHRRLRPYAASPEAGRRIGRILERDGLVPVAASGDIVLFERGGTALPLVTSPVELLRAAPRARIDGALDYYGASLADHVNPATGAVTLETTWVRRGPVEGVYLMRLELRDAAGHVVATHSRPLGYLVWPVADWPLRTGVSERYEWTPGVRLAPGRYSAHMGIARLGATTPPRILATTSDALELGSFSVR